MEIIEYNKTYEESVKDLLVELQEYIISIDDLKLNILSDEYREEYFKNLLLKTTQNEGKIYLAVEENILLGLIAGCEFKYETADKLDYACPKKGEILELVIKKDFRQSGLGSLLITKMEEYFRQTGCKYVQLDVFEPNKNAKNFYNKHDYKPRMTTLFKKL